MQNRRWLVAFLDWQQMRKSAFDLCVKPELDDPDGSLLLGNSLRLDTRLRDPYPSLGFQCNRAHVDRVRLGADASVLIEDRIHLQHLVGSKRPGFHDREDEVGLQYQCG